MPRSPAYWPSICDAENRLFARYGIKGSSNPDARTNSRRFVHSSLLLSPLSNHLAAGCRTSCVVFAVLLHVYVFSRCE
ncbi:hypothetical protein TNCV_4319931 [Trichonephila clavipes]|nr:hypothetical protein TNCV_4319931 [Trichonephila clavipes]